MAGSTDGNLSGQPTPSPGGWFSAFLSKYQINVHGLILVWTRLLGGSGNSTFGFATAVDSNLNQLICGTTFVALNGPLAGSQDLFIAQYDSNGNQSWIRQLGAIGTSSTCFALTLDSANNIYMTGETSANLDGNTKAGNKDLFIIKYDAKGNKLWTKLFGAPGGATIGNSIALSSNHNEIRVAGETCANLGGQTLIGTCDGFYSRFDSNGNHIATTLVGSVGVKSQFLALKVDSIGSSILGGETYGSIGAQLTGLKDLLIKKIP